MAPAATMRATTGSAVASTTSSTCPATACRPRRLRPRCSSTVRSPALSDNSPKANPSAAGVAECAVVGVSDGLTGQAVSAFVSLKPGYEHNEQTRKDLVLQVRKSIGPFAAPKAIYTVVDLPKTRSGKIMRRLLRKILAGEEDQLGDISTVRLPLFSVDEMLTVRSFRTPVLWKRSSPR
jgi:AMP-binding enzyme C-terminal domain